MYALAPFDLPAIAPAPIISLAPELRFGPNVHNSPAELASYCFGVQLNKHNMLGTDGDFKPPRIA